MVGENKLHDLHDFMKQVTDEMHSEYARIRKRASEDPGTAGDQGEENWAEVLRRWLPKIYTVVTKGRIIGANGKVSPQVDVLVLKGSYPEGLLNKKLYLAAGVAAAFECKNTLTAAHVLEAAATARAVKELLDVREGTPYKELVSPICFGLLAHSHSWTGEKSQPDGNIARKLAEAEQSCDHPRKLLDLICVADLATWRLMSFIYNGPAISGWDEIKHLYGGMPHATTSYICSSNISVNQLSHFTPIGAMISTLTYKLAWEDPSLRDLADYYQVVSLGGNGVGDMKRWPLAIYSQATLQHLHAGKIYNGPKWEEWNVAI